MLKRKELRVCFFKATPQLPLAPPPPPPPPLLRIDGQDKYSNQGALQRAKLARLEDRRNEHCTRAFDKITKGGPLSNHLTPIRSIAFDYSLRNSNSWTSFACKTERLRRSFFPTILMANATSFKLHKQDAVIESRESRIDIVLGTRKGRRLRNNWCNARASSCWESPILDYKQWSNSWEAFKL